MPSGTGPPLRLPLPILSYSERGPVTAPRSRGYIVLTRGWRDTPALQDKGEMTKPDAWVWMLETACFTDTPYNACGKTILVKRGQFSTSLRQLASTFGWPKGNVQRFLARLVQDGMILTGTEGGQMLLTLCNYDKHQLTPSGSDPATAVHPPGQNRSSDRSSDRSGNKQQDQTVTDNPGPPIGPPIGPNVVQQRDTKESRESRRDSRGEVSHARGQGDLVPDHRAAAVLPRTLASRTTLRLEVGQITEGFANAITEFCGAGQAPPFPRQADGLAANQWLATGEDIGLPAAAVIEIATGLFRETMHRRQQTGEGPPGSLSYFSKEVLRLIARRMQPRPVVQLHVPLPIVGGAVRRVSVPTAAEKLRAMCVGED